MQLRKAAWPRLHTPSKYELVWNSFFVSCEDSKVSTRLSCMDTSQANCAGPENRARILAAPYKTRNREESCGVVGPKWWYESTTLLMEDYERVFRRISSLSSGTRPGQVYARTWKSRGSVDILSDTAVFLCGDVPE